jgi:hypothetical protein
VVPLARQPYEQGDPIGQIFAYWAVVFFLQFFQNYRSFPHIRPLFNTVKFLCINFDETRFGLHLGRFFQTNLSGHPANESIREGRRSKRSATKKSIQF